MEIETVSNNGFDIAILQGAMTISTLASLTPALTSFIQEHPDNNVVIDLSKVPSIDASAVRLLLNINKKLDLAKRKLYLLNPSEAQTALLSTTSENVPIHTINSISELQQNVNDNTYQHYLPFTIQEDAFLRMHLSCGVCGSANVFGYLLNKNDYIWRWPDNDYFPECLLQSGEGFDYFSVLPIICTDCLMASIEIAHFNVIDNNNVVRYHNTLSDQIKLLLSKTIKKRKKLLDETNGIISDNYFKAPRNQSVAYYSYLLAESCARIASINYNEINMFNVGYLNYLALFYCEKSMKSSLIDDCRTFFTQVVSSPERYNHVQLSQAYYIIFVSSLSLGKFKDLSKIMENYTALMEQKANISDTLNSIESPSFWFNRADEIWKNEISKKSSAFVL